MNRFFRVERSSRACGVKEDWPFFETADVDGPKSEAPTVAIEGAEVPPSRAFFSLAAGVYGFFMPFPTSSRGCAA